MSTIAHSITGTETYLHFDYVVFKKVTGPRYNFVGSGTTKGLPHQTLRAVEDKARRFIEEDLDDWDARTMSAHISIYEVLNLLCS